MQAGMKKRIINLKYPQSLVIKSPHFRRKIKQLFLELNQANMDSILSYLRLAEIINLYWSMKKSYRLKSMMKMITKSLILSKREFSKWEEQQFLDLLIIQNQRKSNKISQIIKVQTNEGSATDRSHKINKAHSYNSPSLLHPMDHNSNETSVLSYCRQKIGNDVERTYFRSQKIDIINKTQKNISQSKNDGLKPDPQTAQSQTSRWSEATSNCNNQQQINKMQQYLTKVLLRISKKNTKLGYIQGFNYIVKNMYLTGFTQQQAQKYMYYFLEVKCLNNVISNNMSGIRQLSYVLKVYIFNYVPKVYKHFQHSDVQPQIFSTSWFITLFSEDLSSIIVNKLWHLFVMEGWKVFIQFGIAILCVYQNDIISKQDDEIFPFIRRLMSIFNFQRRKKHQLEANVWKLMASIEVSDFIIKQLCAKIQFLQKDPEIQVWRLDQVNRKRVYSERNFSQYSDDSQQTMNFSSNFCCDRVATQSSTPKMRNAFPFCKNVGSRAD